VAAGLSDSFVVAHVWDTTHPDDVVRLTASDLPAGIAGPDSGEVDGDDLGTSGGPVPSRGKRSITYIPSRRRVDCQQKYEGVSAFL